MSKYDLNDKKIAELRANRAKSIVNNTQEKLEREAYNEKAAQHNYPKLKKPLSELFLK